MGYPVSPAVLVRPLGAPRGDNSNFSVDSVITVTSDFAHDDGNGQDDNDVQDYDTDNDNDNDDIASHAFVGPSGLVQESVPVPDQPLRDIPTKIRRFRSRSTSHFDYLIRTWFGSHLKLLV